MGRKRNNKATREDRLLQVNDRQVPVRIYREYRRNVRASIGKKAAILRMPLQLPQAEQQKSLQWFKNWLGERLENSADIAGHFEERTYQDGDELVVGQRRYRLRIQWEDRKSHNGRLLPDGTILLKLSRHDSGHSLSKSLQHLLSRVVAQDFLPEITRRVHELNERHFRQPIDQVRLKYNHSNWGSCSNKGNINLSTRLLFAPPEVIDYVIIHELAHRLEMNHSPRFWKLVADAMPNYREHESWLKEHGKGLGF
jgi:predicted metal-dependent hydrolase